MSFFWLARSKSSKWATLELNSFSALSISLMLGIDLRSAPARHASVLSPLSWSEGVSRSISSMCGMPGDSGELNGKL